MTTSKQRQSTKAGLATAEQVTAADRWALLLWLCGRAKDKSARGLQAQRTLARLLRANSLDVGFRLVLADMADPDGPSAMRLTIQRRPHRPRRAGHLDIAFFVSKEIQAGRPKEAAVAAAVAAFGVKRSTVFAACKKWGQ
jgi:hypothetical protein